VAVVLANMQVWYKIFAGFGLFCAFIMQFGGIIKSFGQLKAYNAAMAEFDKLGKDNKDAPRGYVG
jgi:hypothetical protein